MLKIWGRRNSTNVKKALWCAEEIGLAYESIEVGGAFGPLDTPAYSALNPNRLVPTIEDGEAVIWESNAVVRYLGARYGDASLYPSDPAARATGDKWMDWALGFAPAFRDVFWNMVRLPEGQRDMAAVERGLVRCSQLLAVPDAALAKTPYLSGETFAIGDIPLGCSIHGWFAMPIARPDLPHLKAWYDRLCQRAAYTKVVALPLT